MSSPLADFTDVQARYPSTIPVGDTDRVNALLADASAKVRNYTRQNFTLTTDSTRVRPIGDKVRLPQHPVVSVDSVTVIDANLNLLTLAGWVWDGGDEVWLTVGDTIINLAEGVRELFDCHTPLVEVTYTHGYATVPDDVVAVVCGMVTRTVAAPGMGAIRSQTAGPFSQTLSDTAIQGVAALSEADKETLNRYRRSARTVELR